MVAVVECLPVFPSLAVSKTFEESRSLLDVLCDLERHEKYPSYRARVAPQLALRTPHPDHAVWLWMKLIASVVLQRAGPCESDGVTESDTGLGCLEGMCAGSSTSGECLKDPTRDSELTDALICAYLRAPGATLSQAWSICRIESPRAGDRVRACTGCGTASCAVISNGCARCSAHWYVAGKRRNAG